MTFGHSAQALAFERAADDYERGRTGWPDGICDGIAARTVLDLAAGTGKLTRVLIRRYPRVIAVDPLPAMRSVGERIVPDAEWLDGAAERIPLPDASVEAVFVAEAFHWFDPVSATREIARVTRSGGAVVVAFTEWEGAFEPTIPSAALQIMQALSDRAGVTGGPKWRSGAWAAGFAGAPFLPLAHRAIPFVHRSDAAGVIACYLSMSTIASRPQSERDELAKRMRELVPEGEYLLRVRAEVYTTHRT